MVPDLPPPPEIPGSHNRHRLRITHPSMQVFPHNSWSKIVITEQYLPPDPPRQTYFLPLVVDKWKKCDDRLLEFDTDPPLHFGVCYNIVDCICIHRLESHTVSRSIYTAAPNQYEPCSMPIVLVPIGPIANSIWYRTIQSIDLAICANIRIFDEMMPMGPK